MIPERGQASIGDVIPVTGLLAIVNIEVKQLHCADSLTHSWITGPSRWELGVVGVGGEYVMLAENTATVVGYSGCGSRAV